MTNKKIKKALGKIELKYLLLTEKIGDFTYKITWTCQALVKHRKRYGIKKILKMGGWL